MKKNIQKLFGLTFLALLLIQCNTVTEKIESTVKFSANDPFQQTIVPSQNFKLNANIDNVVEGKNGTILIMPKGCFKNSKGEIVTEQIKVELSEALSIEEMLLSNLTTTSDGKLLETDGMIYINATVNGEQLTINKENPIHIEIPTNKRKAEMMAYKGIRDENGNMNWIEPKELKKFLVPIDINSLDFYPEGFETEVNNGMPFRNHTTATRKLTDSLYYSLSISNGSDLLDVLVPTDYNEPYYNKNKEVINGKYTDKSFESDVSMDSTTTEEVTEESPAVCGIDPAIIKVIKDEKYQNTLIATREFETRLQIIFKACRNDILEIYIKNLDKNLWELDSMAAITLGEHRQYGDFYDFYKQGLTNVKEANKYSELLQTYYEERFQEVKTELESVNRKAIKELQKQNKIAEKTASKYKKLLLKRETHRMETYGFEWTETGWINIDRGTIPKDWGPQRLEMIVQNGKNYDRVHTYVVYTSIKSLYRLNSTDGESFFVGNDEQKEMLMPKKQLAVAISIAYKDDIPYLALKEFETGSEPQIKLSLQESSSQKIKEAIKPYNGYGKENRIDKDLEFMVLFAKEKKRQEKLKTESQFIGRLWSISNPCCASESDTLATLEYAE
jgi:hypothetical protein